MARGKHEKGRRGAGGQPPAEAPPPPPPRDPIVERLLALRGRLLTGDAAGALADLDAWLRTLGHGAAAADVAPPPPAPAQPTAPEPAPTPTPPPAAAEPAGPRFSILMCAYNRAPLIGEAIESALGQTFADFELVIVDDGSTDATPDVVRRHAEQDARLRFVRKPVNEGRSATRNRAVQEARGDYLLWMADDDHLMPDTLARYAAVLDAHPDVDVVYGNLEIFDGATGEAVDTYEPNDWTGRSDDVVGAKLFGSVVPDGGTASRRALYAEVGPYDAEFVRAQDYEFWSRLAGRATFHKVDAIVYRYRKHDGGVSFGSFLDLSLESKIIRRLLTRHPLRVFFPRLEWDAAPGLAQASALAQVARNLKLYEDPHNALRLLTATGAPGWSDDATRLTVDLHLMAGDFAGAEAAVDAFAAAQPRPHTLTEALRARVAGARRRAADLEAALERQDPPAAEREARALRAELEAWSFPAAFGFARALEQSGQPADALPLACVAVRLDPTHDAAFALAQRLRTDTGAADHKTDALAMRRRQLERFYDPPATPAPPAADGPPTTVVLVDRGGAGLAQAARSVLAQTHTALSLVIVGAAPADLDDPRVRVVAGTGDEAADRAAGLAAAEDAWIAWIDDDACWLPTHLAGLHAARGEAQVVTGEAWRARTTVGEDGVPRTTERLLTHPAPVDRDALLAHDRVPLSVVLHHRDAAPVFEDHGPVTPWDALLRLVIEHPFAHAGEPSALVAAAPRRAPARDDVLALYRRHEKAALFSRRARTAQAQVLARYGLAATGVGRSSVVLLADADAERTRRAAERLLAHTWVPFQVVVVSDAGDEPLRVVLKALRDAHEGRLSVVHNRVRVGWAKAVNQGLAEADGDLVALLRADVEVPPRWLGRLQWWATRAPDTGVVAASAGEAATTADALGAATPVQRVDDRCLVFTRGLIERVGGMDTALDADRLALDDYLVRAHLAGYRALRADDVVVVGERRPTPTEGPGAERFRRAWGALPTDDAVPDAEGPYEAERHRLPVGAEHGFRPDQRPVTIEEAAARNVLVYPPWDDAAALAALAGVLRDAPAADAAFWLRCAPGQGETAKAAFEAAAGDGPLPDVLVVDAPLAPDREAGLYVAAQAVLVDEAWPDAPQTLRRAADTGRPALRDAAALRAWLLQAQPAGPASG
ncbi:MAG: glycosyltransferase family 2 protein [Myxococcales bacterium]|nr:glycosyltransferase family 2 protein [Myxococcales bacterium]